MGGYLGVGRMATAKGWRQQLHAHPFTEFVVVLDGRLEVELPGRTIAAGPGDLVRYPPHAPHRERAVARTDFVFFSTEADCAALPERLPAADARVRLLAEWLHAERAADRAGGRAVQEALAGALLAEASARGPAVDPRLADLRAHLRERLAEPLTVTGLARRAGLSRAHFIRTIRALAGRTPMAELRRLRAEAARDLVISTPLPLREIARRTGFCDEYHLSRVFRRHFGAPPSRWRC